MKAVEGGEGKGRRSLELTLLLGGGTGGFLAASLGKGAERCFSDPILFSNGPNEARLGHLVFQMSQMRLI